MWHDIAEATMKMIRVYDLCYNQIYIYQASSMYINFIENQRLLTKFLPFRLGDININRWDIGSAQNTQNWRRYGRLLNSGIIDLDFSDTESD